MKTTRARVVGPVYLDASALVKLYLPEPESRRLEEYIVGRRDLVVSDLAITEVSSAIARRRRDGQLDARTAARIRSRMLDQAEQGYFRVPSLGPAEHRLAERLLFEIEIRGLRTLDALHLALALTTETRTLATWDEKLGAAATLAGLQVLP